MTKHEIGGNPLRRTLILHGGMPGSDAQLCLQSHYAAIVEAHKDVEIYQLGDVDCPSCLRRMAEKHAAIAEVFRARLAKLAPPRCRIYDTACMNPSYCDTRDACCAGDPDCRAEVP